MKQPPFNDFLGQYLVQILSPRREAAFLYDAVKLYAKSLKESLENGEDVFNGTRIIERLKNRSYTRYEILFFLIKTGNLKKRQLLHLAIFQPLLAIFSPSTYVSFTKFWC